MHKELYRELACILLGFISFRVMGCGGLFLLGLGCFFFLVSYKKLAEVVVFSSILILTVELLI